MTCPSEENESMEHRKHNKQNRAGSEATSDEQRTDVGAGGGETGEGLHIRPWGPLRGINMKTQSDIKSDAQFNYVTRDLIQ